MLIQVFKILLSLALQLRVNAKLRGKTLGERTDLALYPEDYYGISSGGDMQKPYMKKLGFNIFGNKRNDTLFIPGDYLYREYGFVSDTTKRRKKGMKKGGKKKNRLKQDQFKRFDMFTATTESTNEETTTESIVEETTTMAKPTRSKLKLKIKPSSTTRRSNQTRHEYIWDIWPSITLSKIPTLPSPRRTKTLSTHFPSAFSVTKTTRPWRLIEWSRGPTGPDEIYYNFYNDYYVSVQVGQMNTYIGTPPKCHNQAFKLDGQVVNAPVHEELYDYAFLDYLKDRVQKYRTWSVYVKANPCFTTLTKFFGTTKILALFAARPLMQGKDRNEKGALELYRKDYVVMTERMPTRSSTRVLALFMTSLPKRMTFISEEPRILTKADIETINEEEMFSKLRESDARRKTSLLPQRTRSPSRRNEWIGSIKTRLFSSRPKYMTEMRNIGTPEESTSETDDLDEPEMKAKGKPAVENNNLGNVQRFAKPKYDAREEPVGGNVIFCYHCVQDGGMDRKRVPPYSHCHNLYERLDKRYIHGSGNQRRYQSIKCTFDKNQHTQKSIKPRQYSSKRYRLGCSHRFLDVPSPYDDRSCRKWPPNGLWPHFARKRFVRLEKLLRYTEDGCVSSPLASLTPFARGVNLWVRYHVCVCSTNYCNPGHRLNINLALVFLSLYRFY